MAFMAVATARGDDGGCGMAIGARGCAGAQPGEA